MKSQLPDDRIQRALDGLLSPEELGVFKAEVIRDADLRSAYVEQLWLHSTLRAERESLVELLHGAAPSETKVVRRWPMATWTAAVAACVTLAASGMLFGGNTIFRRPVATLVQAENCKWAGSDLPTAVNSKLGSGTLALVEGIATLQFKNGAKVTIEAPTKLQILNAMHCRLLEGSLTAEVPEPAHGFTVDTQDLKVVDLGTRFGLTTSSIGNSQVHVFEGEVEVDAVAGGERRRLTEGKGLHVGSGNTALGQEPMREHEMQQADGWTAISTAFGRGKDAYARRKDPHGPAGAHPLIMVKHSELPASRNNERRAVISFDVSQVSARNVGEAQVVLDPEPSGFGFSALVPDSRFALYGITDEGFDAWDEKKMTWDAMPACSDAGVGTGQARKLAEFWIPRGGSGGPLSVRGEALAEFVRQDTNGLVSFIIVRETGETDPSGLVHAFASKEHPNARPPTLRIK
ncbi:MAG TPA: FecR domain-containing protein [Chthoniobacteraceae bacterium]|nr:FecR domain-containing protein [Chthoniobacteraceae bacterium]